MRGSRPRLQPLPANQNPLCQVARRKLIEAKQSPDGRSLYPLQLMRWALESGKVKLKDGHSHDLRVMLDQLDYHSEPLSALRFLLGPENPHGPFSLEEMRSHSPKWVAEELWDQLHGRMAATREGYPPKIAG